MQVLLYLLSAIFLYFSPPAATEAVGVDLQATSPQFQERLCLRVRRHYAEHPRMWKRVNERIAKRFHFTCTREVLKVKDVVATSTFTLELELNQDVMITKEFDPRHFVLHHGDEDWIPNRVVVFERPHQKYGYVLELSFGKEFDSSQYVQLEVRDLDDKHVFEHTLHTLFIHEPWPGSVLEVQELVQTDDILVVSPGDLLVSVLPFSITNSCDSLSAVESISLQARWDSNALESAIITRDGDHISETGVFDASGKTNVYFREIVFFEPCETITFDVLVNVSHNATPGQHTQVGIEHAYDIFSDANDIEGYFPIRGKAMEITE